MDKWTLFDHEVFRLFVRVGEVVEVRIPGAHGKSPAWGGDYAKGTVSGYFHDHAALCDTVKLADQTPHGGIYFTLQVIDPRLLGRAYNRLKPSKSTTADHHVKAYRWLPVDTDPVRPAGISASESELAAALAMRDETAGWVMAEYGLGAPIRAVSGNGGHLLFELDDLPATQENTALVKAMLDTISERFSNEHVSVDRTNFNPARIWKLYGTTARKGDEVPAGPYGAARAHRMAFIDDLGGQLS